MEKKGHIRVTMLGSFTLQQEGMTAPQTVSLSGRAGRLWTLLAYLILHRDKGVSAQELIELLWPGSDSSNPAATLQNNVSRLRNALSAMGFANPRALVRYEDGFYKWAPDGDTWLDADAFEELVRRALGVEKQAAFLPLARQAVELYQGDFLPEAATELWCVSLNTYYRSLYIRLCRKMAHDLLQAENYSEAVLLCTRVVKLDPMAEEFNVLLMRALTRSHQPRRALEHYENIQQFYRTDYGMNPSPELEAEKHAAEQELYGAGMNEEGLRSFLMKDSAETTALCCDNSTFREVTKLYMRAMRRDNAQTQLLMMCLECSETQPEKNAVYMQQMKLTLQSCLRAGDPFTQLGASQFWVLLPGAGPHTQKAITDRLNASLYRRFPQTKAAFRYKMFDLRDMNDLLVPGITGKSI